MKFTSVLVFKFLFSKPTLNGNAFGESCLYSSLNPFQLFSPVVNALKLTPDAHTVVVCVVKRGEGGPLMNMEPLKLFSSSF